MKNWIYLFLSLTIAACHSNPGENTQRDSTKSNKMQAPVSEQFDLAKLTLNENLPDLMAAQGIKPEAKDSSDNTMLDYEIFKSSDPKVLCFVNTDLSGARGKSKNQVLFHYHVTQKTLACYELSLFNQRQTDTLVSLLGNLGSPVFKQTHVAKGSIELDLNGDEINPEKVVRKTYRVWENKKNGLSYFLSEDGSGQNLATKLIVLNRSTQFGKDWISSLSLDWYKNEKSEPY